MVNAPFLFDGFRNSVLSIINGEREYKGNLEIGLDFLYGYLNMEQ